MGFRLESGSLDVVGVGSGVAWRHCSVDPISWEFTDLDLSGSSQVARTS